MRDVCRPLLSGDCLGGLGETCFIGDIWPLLPLRERRVLELPPLPPLSWAGLDEEDWSESE